MRNLNKNLKKNVPFVLGAIVLSITVFLFNGRKNSNLQEASNVNVDVSCQQNEDIMKNVEMRAVWIPFMSLSVKGECSKEAFESKYLKLLENAKRHKMNAVIVHVRPYSDALYPSKIFPWSHILTGTQGNDPGFNPLEYMVKTTHDYGMEFHAWINPFRVKVNGTPNEISKNSPAYKWLNAPQEQNSDIIMKCGEDLYYNPACEEVRNIIIDGVKEIVENYDVDGIHFDDYFYPKDEPDIDSYSYNKYLKSVTKEASPLDLQRWRMDNVNLLVSGVYNAVKSIKPRVKFGISPGGNLKNVKEVSAEVETWGRDKGYVDYLCPQIYFSMEHPILPFKQAADEWRNVVKNESVNLYLGMGVYKAGTEVDEGTWKGCSDILKKQVEYCRGIRYNGFMLYSIDSLEMPNAKDEVENVMKVLN